MNLIKWAEGGEPPEDLPPGDYKVHIVSAYIEGGTLVTILQWLSRA